MSATAVQVQLAKEKADALNELREVMQASTSDSHKALEQANKHALASALAEQRAQLEEQWQAERTAALRAQQEVCTPRPTDAIAESMIS